MEELQQEIKDLKEFILINVIGIYNSKDINKDFDELLNLHREYIKNNKLPDRVILPSNQKPNA